MTYAILAAGEGSRLFEEGISAPKPLVKVGGECLIDRLLRIFDSCGAEKIVVICNHLRPEVREHLDQCRTRARLVVEQQTTPSSMHSLGVLAPHLRGGRFIATTVDTIFHEEEFRAYAQAFEAATDCDGMMGVTDYVDDEKPLWVETDAEGTITAFLDRNEEGRCHLVSGGIYGLSDGALDILERCLAEGQSRMRNFQRALIGGGLRLKAVCMSHTLDIDHAEDIRKAEQQIQEWRSTSQE